MKEAKQQERPQAVIKKLVRYLLMGWHWPLLVRTGLRNWKAKTVPVGRSLIRFPTPVRVACAVVCGGGGLLGLDDMVGGGVFDGLFGVVGFI